jgi:hypothetical protein
MVDCIVHNRHSSDLLFNIGLISPMYVGWSPFHHLGTYIEIHCTYMTAGVVYGCEIEV